MRDDALAEELNKNRMKIAPPGHQCVNCSAGALNKSTLPSSSSAISRSHGCLVMQNRMLHDSFYSRSTIREDVIFLTSREIRTRNEEGRDNGQY